MDVSIIDYGMGNLRSVLNAFEFIGCKAAVARDPGELAQSSRIVLPGVGAFGDGMSNLREGGWVRALEEYVRVQGKPFLGLCLGMQVLATTGTEHGVHAGLGWIPGVVERLPTSQDLSVRIPHIGWNTVTCARTNGMYEGIGDSADFYFVHSFALGADDRTVVNGYCVHGEQFAASVQMGNVWATQYHPEKSHKAGLRVLRNFLDHCARC
jgi:glutamine amidotransferase